MTKINISAIGKYRDDPGDKTLTIRPALAYTWLGMNVDHPKLKDLMVRRAIQQAIDVPAILDATFDGAVNPAYGLVPPPLTGARSQNLYPYDPAQSKELLKKAGISELQLRLDLSTSTAGGTVAQIIQAQLAEVGIDLKINQMDGASFVAVGQESEGDAWKDSQLRLTTFTTAPDASWVTSWFTCDQVGIWNTQRPCDKNWDALNAEAAVELDQAKRAAMYIKLQDQLKETGAYVFLYHGSKLLADAENRSRRLDARWPMAAVPGCHRRT